MAGVRLLSSRAPLLGPFGGFRRGALSLRVPLARGRHDLTAGAARAGASVVSLRHPLQEAHSVLATQRVEGARHRQLHTSQPLYFGEEVVREPPARPVGPLRSLTRAVRRQAVPMRKEEDQGPTKIGRMVYTFEVGVRALHFYLLLECHSHLRVSAQVAVSKLFPAGFGWQLSSCYAEETFGLGANDTGFFFVTGFGDFCGVFAGHFSYYTAKKFLYDPSIQWGEQAHVALWLATAAFMSGGMWQPFVNFFQAVSGEGNHFNGHLMATSVCCGTMFYTGLRLGRYFLSPVLTAIPAADYGNLRADAQLSVAIGGATACFVGTDVSYGDGNWLRPLIGVEDGMGDLHGSILAGTSTALGFTAVQIVQNAVRPISRSLP